MKDIYLARFVVEAETPIAVGTGNFNIVTDSLVATDVNGLPYIPGTSLAGVLRNSLNKNIDNKKAAEKLEQINSIFGYHDNNEGRGSRLIISSARMVGNDEKVIDGLQPNIINDNEFCNNFTNLPIRQHVRITDKGIAEQKGKFDEQVVYKGTRFCFEMQLLSDGNERDKNAWMDILNEFFRPDFRIGGGTRKGFGKIKIVQAKYCILNLDNDNGENNHLNLYLNKSSELNDPFWNNKIVEEFESNTGVSSDNTIKYEISLTPDDFYLFGSGFGNDVADNFSVSEKIIRWRDNNAPCFEEMILMPATSLKGALAHRTAFYYNKQNKVFIDDIQNKNIDKILYEKGYTDQLHHEESVRDIVTYNNPALKKLFGYSANDEDGARGNVFFSDVYITKKEDANPKLFNHAAINRFTGGTIEGALFSEEVVGAKEQINFEIIVDNNSANIKESELEIWEQCICAFEKALIDLCTGMLPLGGGTMKGHGCFSGEILKNNKDFYNAKN